MLDIWGVERTAEAAATREAISPPDCHGRKEVFSKEAHGFEINWLEPMSDI